MKLHTVVNDKITTNCDDEIDFGLDNQSTGQMISLVTSLYQNPEMAFVRETCSNAYDAHAIAGNLGKPFDFHLPTRLEPYVRIRDYGTGLSEDFMRNSYTKAGLSTKRDDNGQIGGFGVGRLSFLNVADQAAITSYYNGTKIITAINKGEYGNLKMQIQYVGETDEANGLELQFPVEPNRINAFTTAVQDYFKRIERVHPNWVGYKPTIDMVSYGERNELWATRKTGGSGIFAVMGGVAYPFSADAIRGDDDFEKVSALIGTDMDLFFDIGQVIPIPSREALDMNIKTRKALLERLLVVREKIITGLTKKINDCKYLFEAIAVYQETLEPLSWSMTHFVNNLDLDFDGVKLRNNRIVEVKSPTVKVKIDDKEVHTQTVTFYSRVKKSGGGSFWRTKATPNLQIEAKNFDKAIFVLHDLVKGMRPTIDYNYGSESDVFLVSQIKDKGLKKTKQALIKMGVPKSNIKFSSELDEIPKEERVSSIRSNTVFTQLNTDFIGRNTRNCGDYVEMADLEEGTVYVQAFNCEIISEDFVFSNRYNFLRRYDIIPKTKVVVINKTQYRHIDSNWISMEDYISQFDVEYEKFKKKAKTYAVVSHRANLLKAYTKPMLSEKKRYWDEQDLTINAKYQAPLSKMLTINYGADRNDLNDLVYMFAKSISTIKTIKKKFVSLKSEEEIESFCRLVGLDFESVKVQGTPTCRAFIRMTNLRDSYFYKVAEENGNLNPKLLIKELTND